jgi:hypothetical protein
LTVYSFPEPFWVKDLCNSSKWHPEQGPRQRFKVRKVPVADAYVLVSVLGYGATSTARK